MVRAGGRTEFPRRRRSQSGREGGPWGIRWIPSRDGGGELIVGSSITSENKEKGNLGRLAIISCLVSPAPYALMKNRFFTAYALERREY
jgi:hypothetical protein